MCAGTKSQVLACRGDSGGALICVDKNGVHKWVFQIFQVQKKILILEFAESQVGVRLIAINIEVGRLSLPKSIFTKTGSIKRYKLM